MCGPLDTEFVLQSQGCEFEPHSREHVVLLSKALNRNNSTLPRCKWIPWTMIAAPSLWSWLKPMLPPPQATAPVNTISLTRIIINHTSFSRFNLEIVCQLRLRNHHDVWHRYRHKHASPGRQLSPYEAYQLSPHWSFPHNVHITWYGTAIRFPIENKQHCFSRCAWNLMIPREIGKCSTGNVK